MIHEIRLSTAKKKIAASVAMMTTMIVETMVSWRDVQVTFRPSWRTSEKKRSGLKGFFGAGAVAAGA